MTKQSSITQRLQQVEGRLTRSRARILHAILGSSEETFHLSARQLAKRYAVDPATITRTVRELGYDSFSAFTDDLRAHFVQTVTPLQTFEEDVHSNRSETETIALSFLRAADNISSAGREINAPALMIAADRIIKARRILIVGADLLYSCAFHLEYGLNVLGIAAQAPQQHVAMTYAARALGPSDALIVFGFRRTLKISAETTALARQHGSYVLGITDHDNSLIAQTADYALQASISSPVFTSTMTAVMAVVEALLAACAFARGPQARDLLALIDQDYRQGDRWFAGDAAAFVTENQPKK